MKNLLMIILVELLEESVMKLNRRQILAGVLLWLCVFVASFLIYPIKQADPAFFETLITIILCTSTVMIARLYFTRTELNTKNCVGTGVVWALINILIDLPLFSFGPMQRSTLDYFTDIGCTYLVIPIILWLLSYRRSAA